MTPAVHLESIGVRPAEKNDVEALARLAEEFGYASSAVQVGGRLDSIGGDPRHAAFVATIHRGEVIGWIQLSEVRSLVADARAEITGLVVDARHRGCGVEELLVEEGKPGLATGEWKPSECVPM